MSLVPPLLVVQYMSEDGQDDGFTSYIMGIMNPMFVVPDDYIFKQGEIGLEMYFLVKGEVAVLKDAGTDHEDVLTTLGTGTFFGEVSAGVGSQRVQVPCVPRGVQRNPRSLPVCRTDCGVDRYQAHGVRARDDVLQPVHAQEGRFEPHDPALPDSGADDAGARAGRRLLTRSAVAWWHLTCAMTGGAAVLRTRS